MNEYIFKGCRVDNGETVVGDLRHIREDGRKRTFIRVLDDGPDKDREYEVFPESVGLYSGFTDVNGRRIFEHDHCCVFRPCILEYGTVEFKYGCFYFVSAGVAGMIRLADITPNGYKIEVERNERKTHS